MVKQKNQSMELAKLAAACFVVFIHAPFPGSMGTTVTAIARFAVPFFFAVSGYYSFSINAGKIKKRIVHLLKLHLITAILCIGMYCLLTPFSGGSMVDVTYYLRYSALPDLPKLARWLLLQENPYGGHLWYLSALLLCYLVLWGYTLFWEGERQDNRPLYLASFSLLSIYIVLSILVQLDGVQIPFMAYRNGWLTGIPMFTMGMFLQEHQDRLLSRFCLTSRNLCLWTTLGILLTLLQNAAGYPSEIPLGMFLAVPSLLLLMAKNPQLPIKGRWVQKVVSRLGTISTAVYILHIFVIRVYDTFLKDFACTLLSSKEDNLRPLIIVALSLAVSLLWERISWLFSRKK